MPPLRFRVILLLLALHCSLLQRASWEPASQDQVLREHLGQLMAFTRMGTSSCFSMVVYVVRPRSEREGGEEGEGGRRRRRRGGRREKELHEVKIDRKGGTPLRESEVRAGRTCLNTTKAKQRGEGWPHLFEHHQSQTKR